MSSANQYDVIIIGGGHNGLVAAGLLAKRGRRVVVLEKRAVTGGAAITETPWGPDYKVTSLSYVVSLMSPTVLRELDLPRYGYKVYPQHGYFVGYPDGRHLIMADSPARRREQVAKFSAKDAEAIDRWDEWLGGLAGLLGPLLSSVPPKFGSWSFPDALAQAKFGWKLRGITQKQIADVTRLMTMSIADLLEEFFESPQIRGVLSVSGIIGTWAGPKSPGTAYVMMHHKIGDVGDGRVGSWGFPEGGMGGLTSAMRRAAEALGVEIRTNATVGRIDVADGRVRGVVLANGEELEAPVVVTTTHPKVAFLGQIESKHLPDDFVQALRRWKTRSGTVKINLAVDRLPEFSSKPGFDPEVHGGTIVLAQSLDDLEGAFQDAVGGSAARKPFADICIPSVFDPTLAPPGKHIVSMFTQWVPHTWASQPDGVELQAYADRVIARVEEIAPGFTSSILHRQVIGPAEMEREYGLIGGNIFHGELSANQLFFLRPAVGFADFRTPICGLYQASSATHGGGGVTAIPALQVVKQILKDTLST
jgi:phytoene dehydrogenase-like protein